MDNLRTSLKIIFGQNSIDSLFEEIFSKSHSSVSNNFSEKLFLQQGIVYFSHYSLDEISNIYNKLIEDWFLDVYHPVKGVTSIFSLLNHFTHQILTEIQTEPYVKYEHLLKWRDLSFSLGEDLFTSSYLAYMDLRSGRKRSLFSWRPVAYTTNNRLKSILEKGVAENHFHLKGSAPVFDLAWISLVNNIQGRQSEFENLKLGAKLSSTISSSFTDSESDIEILVCKAAYIRLIIFEYLHSVSNDRFLQQSEQLLKHPSNSNDSFELLINLSSIQQEIEVIKDQFGYKFAFKDGKVCPDYAISKGIHVENFDGSILLSGERKFLYDCFHKVYIKDCHFERFKDLFFLYLLIKNSLRNELIQINSNVGFGNFSAYQDRKELFIKKGSIYDNAFISMAVNDTLKFQNITHFETRLTPQDNSIKLDKALSKLDQIISDSKIDPDIDDKKIDKFLSKVSAKGSESDALLHFYTLHFIKKREKNENQLFAQALITPRNSLLREEVKKQARAIVELRESYSHNSYRVKGIDAASSEFNARPEVFAQAFRFLKDHKLSGRHNALKEKIIENKLSATFHAGEDFYDIADGLRTIDEAIKFLRLGQGDRIGHALALGVDSKDFFTFKNLKIMLPKQTLLDNIAWVLAKVKHFGINILNNEVNKLEDLFEKLIREIYTQNLTSELYHNKYFSHSTYYDSWKLRGDDPYLYLDNWENDISKVPSFTYWERCRINYFYPNSNIRKSNDVKFLYHAYHFNPQVKYFGSQIAQFDVSSDYILLIHEIQGYYQKLVAKLNIGIECNPTSNYLIGTFKRYSKHPILKFNNLGLETNSDELKNCPQLFVSINTDDQGIFSTSLENEYALMAISLEKEKDHLGNAKYAPTMIYNWLDNIRRMGIEQSFYSNK